MTNDRLIDTEVNPNIRRRHTLTRLSVLLCIIAASAVIITRPAAAQTPTPPEQLRQLQELSPGQREALLDALGGQQSTQQTPLTEPVLVTPRRVAQPPPRSEILEGQDIEDLANTTTTAATRPELRPFGYDLFAGVPTTFAPATDAPVPVDYIIGPGDTIELQLFGNENALYTLVVTREGVLNFPKLGPITVAGLRFSDLRSTLQQRVSEQMIGVRISITMGRLRSIRIFILGDAYRPGSYTVSALSTMTNALLVSGGINSIGSLRNIQLKRSGELVTTLDLYDLLLRGDTSGDSRLQPGDVIFIPPVGKTVGVDGEVRRPAIYELKNERSTKDMLELAGGLLPTAFPEVSQIERIDERRVRTIVNIDLDTSAGLATTVKNDDIIRVYSVLEKREDIVSLAGHVYREGTFQWQPGMRLTDLIASLDYLQPMADPNYVLIRREISESLNIEILSADLSAALAAPGTSADVLLQSRDQLHVFNYDPDRIEILKPIIDELRLQGNRATPSQIVTVSGQVRIPGMYPLESGMRVSDLIRAAGQLDEAAYLFEAELARYDVMTGHYRATDIITINLDNVLYGNASANMLLASYDILNIKKIPQWAELESIEFEGEVRFPGKYPIRQGERLSSVLAGAGGLTELAFADGAIFLRQDLREREQEQLSELAERLEGEAAATASAEAIDADSTAARIALLEQVRATQATGRLVIDLQHAIAAGDDDTSDIVLRDGDRILIPKQSQTVTIIGEVQFPTSHIYEIGVDRDAFILRSGGMTFNADKKRIYVVRANGSVAVDNKSRFFRRSGSNTILRGDTIVVPLDVDRTSQLTLMTQVTTIIYNMAIAAAAVAVF